VKRIDQLLQKWPSPLMVFHLIVVIGIVQMCYLPM